MPIPEHAEFELPWLVDRERRAEPRIPPVPARQAARRVYLPAQTQTPYTVYVPFVAEPTARAREEGFGGAIDPYDPELLKRLGRYDPSLYPARAQPRMPGVGPTAPIPGPGPRPTTGEPPEPMPEFEWWQPSGVTPYLQPWASYVRELLSGPSAMGMIPGIFPQEEEREAYAIPPERWAEGETPWYEGEGYLEAMDRLFESLKFKIPKDEWLAQSAAKRWQSIITKVSALPAENVEAIQTLSQLRYDAGRGWYSIDIPQIQHPEYT